MLPVSTEAMVLHIWQNGRTEKPVKFLLGRNYSAQEALEMGMVNKVVPHAELEDTAYEWAQEILAKSPTSIRMLKFAMNLTDDGMVGQQVLPEKQRVLPI